MAEGSCNAETGKAALVHLKILVVGAGIGGLAAGIALARRGHNVTIFEQAPQMGEVGSAQRGVQRLNPIADFPIGRRWNPNAIEYQSSALKMGSWAFSWG